MPTYEYHCATCDRSFDVVQSFTDDPLTICPTCGSPVRKVFSSVGIVFKGSGFYKTDSRDSKSSVTPPDPKKDTIPSGDTGSPATTGTPPAAKPAAAKEPSGSGSSTPSGAGAPAGA